MNYLTHLNYKEGHILFSLLKNKNHSNILVYGPKYSGKSSLINKVIKDMFNCHGEIKNITNEYHCFNCYKDKNLIQKIKEIIKSFNHYKDNFNYIFIDNLEFLKKNEQNILKVILQNSFNTAKFILISDNYNLIINTLKSSCVNIRISKKNKLDKDINRSWFEKKNKTIFKIQNKDNEKIYEEMIIILKKIYEKFTIVKLKEFCLHLNEINLDYIIFFKKLIEHFLKICDNVCNFKIIKIIAEKENLLKNSYKNIIYLESILLNIYYTKYEI